MLADITVMHCSLFTWKPGKLMCVEHNGLWAQHSFGLYVITLILMLLSAIEGV